MDETKQRKIVGWLLSDRVLYLQTSPFIDSNSFTDPKCKKTLEFVSRFVNEHKQIPSESVIELELGFNPGEEFASEAPTDTERSYIVSELEGFYKESTFRNFLLSGVDMLETGDIDYGLLERQMKGIITSSLKVELGMDYFKDAAERFESLAEGRNLVSTGFSDLDRLLGGWETSELHLIGGATGQGKSIFLSNFSAKNTLAGKNVLTITLELSEKMFGIRYDTIILNKHRDIVIADRNKNTKRLLMLNEATGGSLTVKYYPSAYLTTNALEGYLEQYFIANGFYPDIIYIDYLSLMKPNGKYSSDNSYLKEKDISEELRGLAGILDLPIVSATQLNRSGLDAAVPEKGAVSDSIGKIFTVGTLLNIAQTKAEKQMGLIKLYAAKCRNVEDNWMANFKINYNTLGLEGMGYTSHAGVEDTKADDDDSLSGIS